MIYTKEQFSERLSALCEKARLSHLSEGCEEKLAVLIMEMKAESKAEKERRKQAVSA